MNYFDENAERFSWNTRNSQSFIERYRLWSIMIDKYANSKGRALDLGCGTGELTRTLAQRMSFVTALDNSDAMLRMTYENMHKIPVAENYEIIRAGLPLDREFVDRMRGDYDLIILSSVLEYITGVNILLSQCCEMLRQNGVLMISYPNNRSIYRKVESALAKTSILKNHYSVHIKHSYTNQQLTNKIIDAGMDLKEVLYYGLPRQNVTRYFLPKCRGRYIATMLMLIAKKK